MFGFKQLPWWASCVSSELARILTHERIQVAGLILDDLLLVTKASDPPGDARTKYDLAKKIMADLGIAANNKGELPAHTVIFCGLLIDTLSMTVRISEEHR